MVIVRSMGDHVWITGEVIDVSDVCRLVTSPTCGAISTFVGVTRNNFEGKEVVSLEYEAYDKMALSEMKKICTMVRERWSVEGVAIVHRIGLVPVSEASVVIAVSSPHRRAALDAVSFAIDTLKATVPIWKKERYADGTSSWKENKECCRKGGKS